MNYTNIKEIVINKRWPKGQGKYGDDYRNLSKQMDNFIAYIKNEESPLQWLPLDIMTDEEIADIADKYLDRSSKNRLLLNNLNYKGMRYDYRDLILVDLEENKKELGMIFEESSKLKEYKKLKIKELIPEINLVLVGAQYEGYMKTARRLLEYTDLIQKEILDEKYLFKCMGLGYTNTNYIEQYISICERVCFGALYFLLIKNPNLPDKISEMSKIEEKLYEAYDTIEHEVRVAKKNLVRSREFYKEYYNREPNDAIYISQYYAQFLERQAYYNELNNINELLSREILQKPELYREAKLPLFENISDYKDKELQDYICEGTKYQSYKIWLEETKRIIDFAFNQGNMWGTSKNATTVKIVFREYFISKQPYMRKSSRTIVHNILNGKEVGVRELMFLDMKILRGYFREKNMMQEYFVFNRICSRVRKMFLFVYRAINDTQAYRLVHRTCFEFLYLFGDSKYSGIVIE